MAANVFDGKIEINGQWIKMPFAYFDDYAATKPPFTVTTQYGVTKVEYSVDSTGIPQLITTGTDSLLCIYNRDAYNGPWGVYFRNPDGNVHKVIQLSNGYWIGFKKYPYDGANSIRLCFYDFSDNLISEELIGAFNEGGFG